MTDSQLLSILPALRPKLVSQARRYVKNSDEAEDIAQDVLLRLWTVRATLIGSVEGLAAVMVQRLSLNHLRRTRRLTELPTSVLMETEDPAAQADDAEELARLLSMVDRLPQRQRLILRLHDLEGMDYDKMARLTGTPAPTLRQTVSRTRRQLRLRYLAAISAVVALLVLPLWGYRAYQYRQLERRYEGSYIIVDGRRYDNLRQIRPQLELTLAQAQDIENGIDAQAVVRQAETDVLQSISDPEERRRLEQLLNE